MGIFEEILRQKKVEGNEFLMMLQNAGKVNDLCTIDGICYMTFSYNIADCKVFTYDLHDRFDMEWSYTLADTLLYGAIAVDENLTICKMIYKYTYKWHGRYVKPFTQVINYSDEICIKDVFDKDLNMLCWIVKTKQTNMLKKIIKDRVVYTDYVTRHYRSASIDDESCFEEINEFDHNSDRNYIRTKTLCLPYHGVIKDSVEDFGIVWSDSETIPEKRINPFDCVVSEEYATTIGDVGEELNYSELESRLANEIKTASIIGDSIKQGFSTNSKALEKGFGDLCGSLEKSSVTISDGLKESAEMIGDSIYSLGNSVQVGANRISNMIGEHANVMGASTRKVGSDIRKASYTVSRI